MQSSWSQPTSQTTNSLVPMMKIYLVHVLLFGTLAVYSKDILSDITTTTEQPVPSGKSFFLFGAIIRHFRRRWLGYNEPPMGPTPLYAGPAYPLHGYYNCPAYGCNPSVNYRPTPYENANYYHYAASPVPLGPQPPYNPNNPYGANQQGQQQSTAQQQSNVVIYHTGQEQQQNGGYYGPNIPPLQPPVPPLNGPPPYGPSYPPTGPSFGPPPYGQPVGPALPRPPPPCGRPPYLCPVGR